MERVLRKVNSDPSLKKHLRDVSIFAVIIAAAAYLAVVAAAFVSDVLLGVKLLIITAAPYIVVSLARKIINAKRPYEIYDFYEEPPKNKKGSGFPSRHVFSSFAIGTMICFFEPWLGIMVIASGMAMGMCRVLLGIHFMRDVIAGAMIGVLTSVIGMLIVRI